MGLVARAMLLALQEEPMTARELAARLQLSVDTAKRACSRLHAAEQLRVVERVGVDGACKPAARYGVSDDIPPSPSGLFG